MSSNTAKAITAKARAMYAKRLTARDYEELLNKKSIGELVTYLKNETAYSETLSVLQDNHVRREQLEALLHQDIYKKLGKLIRYTTLKERQFYLLGLMESEVNLLMLKVRMLNMEDSSSLHLEIPEYLKKYADFDLYGLLNVNTYDELLKLIRHSHYYPIFKEFTPEEGERINYDEISRALNKQNYDDYIATVNKLFRGKTRKELLTIVHTNAELKNITKIYRLKRFFKATPEEIRNSIYLVNERIPKKLMNEMIECDNADDVLRILSESSYNVYIDTHEFVFIEYHVSNISYNLSKRYMHFSSDPALVYTTYRYMQSMEIDNLLHIIEGLRYGQSPAAIREILIY